MREIKFRAWDSENKKYLDLEWNDYYLDIDAGELYEIEERTLYHQPYMHKRYLKDVILQQFTGLKDRNGKEVYEGDILSNGQHIDWIVIYHEASLKVRHEGIVRDKWTLTKEMAESREVIGNIYEQEVKPCTD